MGSVHSEHLSLFNVIKVRARKIESAFGASALFHKFHPEITFLQFELARVLYLALVPVALLLLLHSLLLNLRQGEARCTVLVMRLIVNGRHSLIVRERPET